MQKLQIRSAHKPRPLPVGRWAMSQRWNDLLFAHWPVDSSVMATLLPDWLEVDTCQGSAWLGIVPFWLERVKFRGVPSLPGIHGFPDLNLRTYVRDTFTRTPGIYCFSLDASNLVAVGVARTFYHLPYHWAEMRLERQPGGEVVFFSRRRFTGRQATFKARYRGLGPTHASAEPRPGSLESFFTERSCLFSTNRVGQPVRASIESISWPLETARAEIERNDLAGSLGIELPNTDPVLHYSRRLALYIWPAELVRAAVAARPVAAVAAPMG